MGDDIPEGFFVMPIKSIFDPRFGRWMKPAEHERAVEALRAKGEKKILPAAKAVATVPPARRRK
jgi:hypothetical protein